MRIVALSFATLIAIVIGCSQDSADPDYAVEPGTGGAAAVSSNGTSGGTDNGGTNNGGANNGNTGLDAGSFLDDAGITPGNDGGTPGTGTGGVTNGGGLTTGGDAGIDAIDNTQDQTPPLPDQIP